MSFRRENRTRSFAPRRRALVVVGLVALLAAADATAAGVTSLAFEESVLRDLGLSVQSAGSAPAHSAEHAGFAIRDDSTLAFAAPGGDFEGFDGGALRHRGGLILELPDRSVDLSDFELRVSGGPGELALFDRGGRRWLLFEKPQPHVVAGELLLQNVDVNVAPELARALGRPELAGRYLGWAHIAFPLPAGTVATEPSDGGGSAQGDPCADVFTPDRDIALMEIGSVSQLARTPDGPVALTFFARLRNVGTSAIIWNWAIEPDGPPEEVGEHPFLALHLYRILNGRITQIGRSDVKHAFFSVNTSCPCAGGHVIYPDCEDTYGASTNANRHYLAPREEVTASTGDWSSLGSHFDAAPVDDYRDHGGNAFHDGFEHRLLVDENELQTRGYYFVEAWYVIRDDVDIFNGMGHAPVTPNFSGGWIFSTTGALVNGSILDEFVDPVSPPAGSDNQVVDTGEGRLQLAVTTTDLGGGQVHYEYALMNFDFDRQVRSFQIPLEPGVSVSNVDFADADVLAGNDWTVTTGPFFVRFTAPPGNEMDWGTLYSFGFDANAAPVAAQANLGALEPGPGGAVSIATLGPAGGANIPTHPAPLWIAAALLLAGGFMRRRRRVTRGC